MASWKQRNHVFDVIVTIAQSCGTTVVSILKMEKIQYRALKYVYDDYKSS